MRITTKFLTVLISTLVSTPVLAKSNNEPSNHIAGNLFQLSGGYEFPNGAWCWFQDPRAIVDRDKNGQPLLLVSSFSAREKSQFANRIWGQKQSHWAKGDNDLYWMNLVDKTKGQVKIHQGLTQDDHNVGAITVLPDGRYLTAYADHGYERLTYFKTSINPHDPTEWSKATEFTHNSSVTYSNLYTVPTNQTTTAALLNFNRSIDIDPNIMRSNDDGKSWQYVGQLLGGPGRPYMGYAQGKDKVHFLASDQHPRVFDNSIYHGTTDGKAVYSSNGQVIDNDITKGVSPEPQKLTTIHHGKADAVGWGVDIEVDHQDNPYALYSVQVNGQYRGKLPGIDHRYHYARFDGSKWQSFEIAYAGTALYELEQDYTGLAALDPHNPDYVVISTNAHPKTGEPLISKADGQRHWELYEGNTMDEGKSWHWRALTSNSTVDNIRPIIPTWQSEQRVVLWMRGNYTSYIEWDTQIVGVIQDR